MLQVAREIVQVCNRGAASMEVAGRGIEVAGRGIERAGEGVQFVCVMAGISIGLCTCLYLAMSLQRAARQNPAQPRDQQPAPP